MQFASFAIGPQHNNRLFGGKQYNFDHEWVLHFTR